MLAIIKHNLGVYFMVLACLEFALIGACAKMLSKDGLPSIEIMFFRNAIGTLFMLYLLRKVTIHKDGGHFFLLLFRGLAGSISLYLFFYNIAHISLGGAFAFQKTSPIFITLIAFFLFKESVGLRGWLGIFIAFAGVLCIFQPFDSTLAQVDSKNALLGIVSGFFAALALVSVRRLRNFYPTEYIAFSFIAIGTILPFFSMLIGAFYAPSGADFFIAPFVMPSAKSWIFIGIMGVIGVLYQIHITKSYGVAKKAGIVAGVSYLDVVFSVLIGVVFDGFPSALMLLGIGAIVFGGLILVFRKL